MTGFRRVQACVLLALVTLAAAAGRARACARVCVCGRVRVCVRACGSVSLRVCACAYTCARARAHERTSARARLPLLSDGGVRLADDVDVAGGGEGHERPVARAKVATTRVRSRKHSRVPQQKNSAR
eukprot:961160-Pleurochrysis_carterae.AAC.1